jgi:hypothetical protein
LLVAGAAGGWGQSADVGSELKGQIVFNGLAVPGATVTAVRDGKKVVATTDAAGNFSLAGLAGGEWTVTAEMTLFEPATWTVMVPVTGESPKIELKMLPAAGMLALATAAPKLDAPVPVLAARLDAPAAKKNDEAPVARAKSEADSNDGFLINGTTSNAATSKYALAPAFGNTRSSRSLYNWGLAGRLDNAALDARPDSLTGVRTAKPSYNRFTGVATFGGPIRIPKILPRGPKFFVAYEWTRDATDSTLTGLVPTGVTAPANTPQAALLALYPAANLTGAAGYNYQASVQNATHDDAMQMRLSRDIGRRDELYGGYSFESSRASAANLFGFVDKTDTLGMDGNVHWGHRFWQRLYTTTGFTFSRLRTQVDPYFAYRQNVSGDAGVGGNLQDAADWGPPSLSFSSGIAGLSDANSEFNRNRTDGVSESIEFGRGKHEFTFGGDFRREEFNVLAQANPRGSFTFTGAATGSDIGDFLAGVPDTSSIAYGNADKYLRQSAYDAFFTDDWRLRPELTVNAGVRWEYGAPITELKNRLVNLDVDAGFAAADPVLASAPVGALTGFHYPTSLIEPDKRGIEPRIGLSWRPIPGSTLVVRAGYGIYDDTSIYNSTAASMDQQYPLSTSLSVSNGPGCGLTLAAGFIACGATTADNFAVDPNLRVGYAQTWNLSAQRDLPGALVGTVSYLGVKGTRGVQEYLPNTYPIGAGIITSGPEGFVYRTSGGNSTREQAQAQLRRRLRAGFTASVQYTYSKSLDDDAALGGGGPVGAGLAGASAANATIAQNWLNLRGERGLSTFNQRHLVNASAQYSSGQGLGGGTLLGGWAGRVLKEWTAVTTITAGSGLPETPIYLAAVPGTGFTGTIRASLTGAPIYTNTAGVHLNAAAYTAPAAGTWGDARRDSIEGPGQFSMNASLARTFRLKDGYNLDVRADGTNVLNHVVFASWNTTIGSTTFGLPASANAMRSVQITARLRY